MLLRAEASTDRAAQNLDLVQAEMVAARAADAAGGGSPCWGGVRLGPGEELAVAMEVARCLRGDARLVWRAPDPPMNLS